MLCFICTIKLTSEAKIQQVFIGREDMTAAFDFSHQGQALVTRWSRSTSNFYVLIGQDLTWILKLVYFDSWSWQSFVSTWGVFNCLFLLDLRNEIQLLSKVFCYSWLVCLLGFWLRNTSPVKVGNPISDNIESFSFFTLLDWKVWSDVASRSCLSNYCICVCFFHISNFMKPSAVYEAIVYACLN